MVALGLNWLSGHPELPAVESWPQPQDKPEPWGKIRRTLNLEFELKPSSATYFCEPRARRSPALGRICPLCRSEQTISTGSGSRLGWLQHTSACPGNGPPTEGAE